MSKVKPYPEANINCTVKDKEKILANPRLKMQLKEIHEELGKGSRIIVRASGTEPKIRILVESTKWQVANKVAKTIEKLICKIDGE